MSKYLSSMRTQNMLISSSGITNSGGSTAQSGNVVQTPTIITTSSTISTTSGNMLIILNPSSTILVNLPPSPNSGQIYKFVNVSSFDVTLSTNSGSIFFDGQGYNQLVISQFDKLNITFYNNNWFLI